VRPEFREKEDVADNWGRKLLKNYIRKRYWFIPRPAWRIIRWVMRAIAEDL
jgi:hypothetical protein